MSVLVALFFILFGVICLIFPWSEAMKSAVMDFIQHSSIAIAWMGLVVLTIGVVRLIYVALGMKPAYYRVKTDAKAIWIDEAIIQEYADNYWRSQFPAGTVANRVAVKKNKIFLSADLPYVPSQEQKAMLHKFQKDLADLLSLILGYKHSFTLSVTFQPKRTENR